MAVNIDKYGNVQDLRSNFSHMIITLLLSLVWLGLIKSTLVCFGQSWLGLVFMWSSEFVYRLGHTHKK